jgi:hypothetical protein
MLQTVSGSRSGRPFHGQLPRHGPFTSERARRSSQRTPRSLRRANGSGPTVISAATSNTFKSDLEVAEPHVRFVLSDIGARARAIRQTACTHCVRRTTVFAYARNPCFVIIPYPPHSNSPVPNTVREARAEVELGIFTPGENVKITPYHRPIIK